MWVKRQEDREKKKSKSVRLEKEKQELDSRRIYQVNIFMSSSQIDACTVVVRLSSLS